MKEVYAEKLSFMNTKYLTKSEILSGKYDFSNISLQDSLYIDDKKYILNNFEKPISYTDTWGLFKTICINLEYFKQNMEEINKLLVDIIINYKDKLVIKSSALITDEVINAIANNHNITEIYLGSESDIYKLKESDYKKLKNGSIKSIITYGVEKELDNNDDKIIDNKNEVKNKKIVKGYSYNDLMYCSTIILDSPLNENEISYFSISKDLKIVFDYDDYNSIFKNIEKLEMMGSDFSYQINVSDKDKFNEYILNHEIIFGRIDVKVATTTLNIADYLKYEKMLYEMIEPAILLSPYEKFLYAYSITKHFKKYKEVDENDDKINSRNLYKILDNEYIVCAGYAILLQDLLNKLGIKTIDYGVIVDVGFDKVNVLQEKVDEAKSSKAGHARIIINLVDSKYGINGIYQSDPTWDNILDEDSYIYSLMTFDEASKTKRYLYQDKTEYHLLSSKTLEEFYQNVNKYMDEFINNDTLAIKFTEEKARLRVVNDLLGVIKKLDSKYYKVLVMKYNDIDKYDISVINKFFKDFLYDVGCYIVSKSNNPIKLEQIKPCIEFLYTKFYGLSEEDVKKEVNRTIEFNKKRMNEKFPTTYKINQDGTKEVYSYLENKFDADIESKSIK